MGVTIIITIVVPTGTTTAAQPLTSQQLTPLAEITEAEQESLLKGIVGNPGLATLGSDTRVRGICARTHAGTVTSYPMHARIQKAVMLCSFKTCR